MVDKLEKRLNNRKHVGGNMMGKNLVIVESPSKSKTIQKYLGADFEVTSSKGHIRDLATTGKGGLGVDVENDFKPHYVINKDKKDVVKELKKFERVFLKKGESKEITFVLTDDDLKYYDSSLQYGYNPGEFDIMVGPNSANVQTLRFTAE